MLLACPFMSDKFRVVNNSYSFTKSMWSFVCCEQLTVNASLFNSTNLLFLIVLLNNFRNLRNFS